MPVPNQTLFSSPVSCKAIEDVLSPVNVCGTWFLGLVNMFLDVFLNGYYFICFFFYLIAFTYTFCIKK